MKCPKCGYTGKSIHFNGNRLAQCKNCGDVFIKNRSDQKFCSKKCGELYWAKGKGKAYFALHQRERRRRLKSEVQENPLDLTRQFKYHLERRPRRILHIEEINKKTIKYRVEEPSQEFAKIILTCFKNNRLVSVGPYGNGRIVSLKYISVEPRVTLETVFTVTLTRPYKKTDTEDKIK